MKNSLSSNSEMLIQLISLISKYNIDKRVYLMGLSMGGYELLI